MKLTIRVSALVLIIAGAVAGNSLPKVSTASVIHQGTVPYPTPSCNPFTQICPPIRN